MIDYRVRSKSLLELVNEVKSGSLIPDAYFQRNLVWRDVHNQDFIETILLGYPFPQIFISKGKVDVETMSTVSCIVDGQQRTNAIIEFVNGSFEVNGKKFSDLEDKKQFLDYEIAVIELNIENDDPKVQEIFQRINRTSNSLTAIEKLASEFSTSEYMLVSKYLADQIDISRENKGDFKEDPNIPESFYQWANTVKVTKFSSLIVDKKVFTARDLSKKNHLMHVLNMMSAVLGGLSNRNERTLEYLNDYSINFPQKDHLTNLFEKTATIIISLKLKARSYWYNKANIFSLIVAIAYSIENGVVINIDDLKEELLKFEESTPEDYKLAASESVNNTSQRNIRNKYILTLINKSCN
jgi:hypothetical protein